MSPRERRDESENGVDPPQHVHYHQTKNGNSSNSSLNTILLGCLLAIVGFLGIQLWNMNERLARLETNVAISLRQQSQPPP